MVLSVEFSCPLRGDILGFRNPVNGPFLVIDFSDDPPHFPLIQFPHRNRIIYFLFQEKVISGKDTTFSPDKGLNIGWHFIFSNREGNR